ncbi:MAG: NAD synthetase / Glutamine amidotransferase chain of NAD synthetase [uncultured Rubrobacteraceae bacterium]|uniref:Glutamine-dependent NAD(+) synthetase n=1 Tax=uncultured Rubrobacteraceae bacterium TaxID=349277 RepID=A0A6J4PYU5_9ACTN|nr:MAG: NAD synthetase / Glutamine amidotransferase chain of NAD synthetase [uncultured Rubrobacteraceae bacterium]
MTALRIAVAQLPNRVGDLEGNAKRIARAMAWAEQEEQADVLVLPELVLTGYPLADLVLHREFVEDAEEALDWLARQSGRMTTILSTIDRVPPQRSWDTRERDVSIAAKLLCDGEVRGCYHKVLLPVYDLFDEARNFAPGSRPNLVWRIGGVVAGVSICEDMWSPDGPPEAQSAAGAQILLVPNASPFHRGKARSRLDLTRKVAIRNGVPVVYVNFVGGQDDVVFDGGSIIVDGEGTLLARGAEFAEEWFAVDVPVAEPRVINGRLSIVHTRPTVRRDPPGAWKPRPPLDDLEAVWNALVMGVRDYTERNGFKGVALGLSGGIDSAVAAMVAADALGPEGVLAVAMPAPETPDEARADAEDLARNLGVPFDTLPVDMPTTEADVPDEAEPLTKEDAAVRRERRYARARAVALSDIFDERGYLVLATSNKTHISVGAANLLGDLVGGFAPLKDCPKTMLYDLGRYRNSIAEVCPPRILDMQSSSQATLPEGLPSYEVLDEIVERYVEHSASLKDLIDTGFDPVMVTDVMRHIDEAERIRRYTPPGIKITSRAFDQDRRMPLPNSWRTHS